MIRMLKIALVVFAGLQGVLYFAANFANFEVATAVAGQVLAQEDRPYYSASIAPAMTAPALATATIAVIMAGELLVGLLCLAGAVKMAGAAARPGAEFNASKTLAILGCGAALLVWFGIFTVIGGGAFQMWQTDLGRTSLADAHHFLTPSGILLLFLAMRDD